MQFHENLLLLLFLGIGIVGYLLPEVGLLVQHVQILLLNIRRLCVIVFCLLLKDLELLSLAF